MNPWQSQTVGFRVHASVQMLLPVLTHPPRSRGMEGKYPPAGRGTLLGHSRGQHPWQKPGRAGSYLVARRAAGLEALGVVPAAVDLPILVEVDQVDQQLVADAADEAGRVPANAVPCSRGEDGHVPSVDLAAALPEKPVFNGGRASPLPPIASQLLLQPWRKEVLIHSSFLASLNLFSSPCYGQDINSFPPARSQELTRMLYIKYCGVLLARALMDPSARSWQGAQGYSCELHLNLVIKKPPRLHQFVIHHPPARRWLPSWLRGTAGHCLSLNFPSSFDC